MEYAFSVWNQLQVFLIVFMVTCLLLFHFLVHLGWTVLSNNFALITATITGTAISESVNKILAKNIEEQHKVVSYYFIY